MKKMLKLNRKALRLGDLTPAAMIVLVSIIAISIGTQILAKMRDVVDNGTKGWAYNITDTGYAAMADFADWFGIIVVVVVAAIIIGLVVYFGRAGGGRE